MSTFPVLVEDIPLRERHVKGADAVAAAEHGWDMGIQGAASATVPPHQCHPGCREGGLPRVHHRQHHHLCRLLPHHDPRAAGGPAGPASGGVQLPRCALRVHPAPWLPARREPRGLLRRGSQLSMCTLPPQHH
ncbi:chorionic gonadotropin, beta polypeptide 2 [Pan troglodytes]|uniref:Chorionic gonadotropin beta polypeptide 2 n=3 Tax=Pan troglodytes TaxID=9598 RepID=Q2Q1P4_PANTR|nr:chorionic gonadotropin, beta polypeptide 2 [Pan troglodytes]ABB83542.1 chorionic gonadotropin beta polypeptide 2 [Pan troglodytes]